jgi:hypothetical protein
MTSCKSGDPAESAKRQTLRVASQLSQKGPAATGGPRTEWPSAKDRSAQEDRLGESALRPGPGGRPLPSPREQNARQLAPETEERSTDEEGDDTEWHLEDEREEERRLAARVEKEALSMQNPLGDLLECVGKRREEQERLR